MLRKPNGMHGLVALVSLESVPALTDTMEEA